MPLTFRRTCLLAALALLAMFAPLARPALAAPIVVTSLADSGAGSLRAAIIDANASVGGDTITFTAAGTINLSTPLPALTGSNISIDGSVPAGSSVPKVELRGQGMIKGAGILIHSSGNTVRGLILNGFIKEDFGTSPDYGGAGVTISGSTNGVAANNIVEYNYIGTNAAGSAIGNAQDSNNIMAGVLIILGASTNTIRNNVISGNTGMGIYLTRDRNGTDTFAKTSNIIRDNLIGTTAGGGAALPNMHGIWVG
ncbi:MAG: right-handed parallel beta-helix repeat-containing protein, partial [Chloroflexota bacterium]|nr:right-handed parallel beta-helix repeat-containing protein [Chloroflexota bacterium]